MNDEFAIEDEDDEPLIGEDVEVDKPSSPEPGIRRVRPEEIEDDVFGVLGDRGINALSVDEIRRIIQARTGVVLDVNDPIVIELVALDVSFRHYTTQLARLHILGGENMDRQSADVVSGVGEHIDMVAQAVVKAIRENSASVEAAIREAGETVNEAKRVMDRVTSTAKVLLAVTGGVAATTITAIVTAALFSAGGAWFQ